MIKELMHDPIFLALPSDAAAEDDIQTGADLMDTLLAHREECVGMAANMIGVRKRIIVFENEGEYMTMYNPEIIKRDQPYNTKEGCLSLLGGPRECRRYKKIKVRWQNADMSVRIKSFEGFTAEIIQHEIDHLDGILI